MTDSIDPLEPLAAIRGLLLTGGEAKEGKGKGGRGRRARDGEVNGGAKRGKGGGREWREVNGKEREGEMGLVSSHNVFA